MRVWTYYNDDYTALRTEEFDIACNGEKFVSLEDHEAAVKEAVAKEREAHVRHLRRHAKAAVTSGYTEVPKLLRTIADEIQRGLRHHTARQEALSQETSPE